MNSGVRISAGMKTLPRFRCASSLERLEARIAPAVVVARTGAQPNFTVTFSDDSTGDVDNDLTIRFNAATQNLEFSLDRASTFSSDLGGGNTASFGNIGTINADLGVGDDRVVFSLQNFAVTAT